MDKYLGEAWVLMIGLKAIWILIVPTIVTVAACKLWHSVPRWISIAFLLSAAISIVTSGPEFLIMLHGLTPQQYGKIAIHVVVIGGIARIASAIALLALAIKMKTMTEPSLGTIPRVPAGHSDVQG